MANETAATGVAELDRALDGLYWGDNVVWVWEGGAVALARDHRRAGGHAGHQPSRPAGGGPAVLRPVAPPAAAVRLAGGAVGSLGDARRERLLRALLPDAARP